MWLYIKAILEPMLAAIGREVVYTLVRLPVCLRANRERQKAVRTHIYTCGQFRSPVNLTPLTNVFGLWEYPKKTHTQTWGEHANSTEKGQMRHSRLGLDVIT